MNGGAGNDTIRARDGKADAILCGGGRVTVQADPSDAVAPDCERELSAAAGGPSPPARAIVITGGKARAQVSVRVTTLLANPDPDGPGVAEVDCLWSRDDRIRDPAPASIQPCRYTYPQTTSATLVAFGLGFGEVGFQSWGGLLRQREQPHEPLRADGRPRPGRRRELQVPQRHLSRPPLARSVEGEHPPPP